MEMLYCVKCKAPLSDCAVLHKPVVPEHIQGIWYAHCERCGVANELAPNIETAGELPTFRVVGILRLPEQRRYFSLIPRFADDYS